MLLLVLAWPCVSWATIWTCGDGSADSCTPAGLTSLIAGAAHGDTINITVATHAWTSGVPVTVNKRLTIDGGGVCTGCGTASASWASGAILTTGAVTPSFAINVTVAGSGNPIIRGLKFSGAPTFTYQFYDGNGGSLNIRITSTNIVMPRIAHNWFRSTTGDAGVAAFTYGLMDHNLIEVDGVQGHMGVSYKTGASLNGDEGWAAPTGIGGPDFFFIEDNTYLRPPGGGSEGDRSCHDAHVGSKSVFRYNYTKNCDLSLHHGHSGGGWTRPGVFSEVYNNLFHWTVPSDNLFQSEAFIRGGSAYYYSNNHTHSVSGNALQSFIKIWSERATHTPGSSNFLNCNVSPNRAWDQAGPPNGYRCLDQPGTGPAAAVANGPPPTNLQPQAALKMRFWSNIGNVSGTCSTAEHSGKICNSNTDYIIDGTDYCYSDSTTCDPGYTPYTHPHPLQGEAPAPPGGMRHKILAVRTIWGASIAGLVVLLLIEQKRRMLARERVGHG